MSKSYNIAVLPGDGTGPEVVAFEHARNGVAGGKPDKIHVAAIGDFSGPYAPVVGSHKPGYHSSSRPLSSAAKSGSAHGPSANQSS